MDTWVIIIDMIIKRYTFVLFEVFIAIALISLSIIPITSYPYKVYSKEIYSLQQIELERIQETAFAKFTKNMDKTISYTELENGPVDVDLGKFTVDLNLDNNNFKSNNFYTFTGKCKVIIKELSEPHCLLKCALTITPDNPSSPSISSNRLIFATLPSKEANDSNPLNK